MQFDSIINNGTLKYVVTWDGKLLIWSHSVNRQEISHIVLSQIKSVLVVRQAKIAEINALGDFGLDISTHSGIIWMVLQQN